MANDSFTYEGLEIIQAAASRPRVEAALQTTYEFAKLMSYYRCAMMTVETKFKVLNEEFSLDFDRHPILSITTRIKSPVSIIQKMKRNRISLTMDNIEEHIKDVAGVRVICSFTDDVYQLKSAIERQDDIDVLQVKDYIGNPKPNGYRSLHMIVAVPIFLENEKRMMKVEIQLRTIAMDSWAGLEHQLKYKKSNEFTEDMENDLRICANLTAEMDYRMNRLKRQVDSGNGGMNLLEYITSELDKEMSDGEFD